MTSTASRYARIIEAIFLSGFKPGVVEILFSRQDIENTARKLDIRLPKNLGDVIYSFRYRAELPDAILEKAGKGKEWIIRPAGRSLYKFVLVQQAKITPSKLLVETKIPDSTPGIIEKYALSDEQALLAKLRYNRLVDIFTGLTCYSLQSHLRTSMPGVGQVETDEVYIAIDRDGVHYVITVQAKGGNDKIGIVQIEQDLEICNHKFHGLTPRPIAAQFLEHNLICLFEFTKMDGQIKVFQEKHYRLVQPDLLTDQDIEQYKKLTSH